MTDQPSETVVQVVIEHTAAELGNTPAVCRDYYVHPAVMASFENGRWEALTQAGLPTAVDGYGSSELLTLQLMQDAGS